MSQFGDHIEVPEAIGCIKTVDFCNTCIHNVLKEMLACFHSSLHLIKQSFVK